ncbi:MAG: outer membrane protein assembly factor BamD [Deltaproteobacteria bacterium]|nr:MAG: outer membrane protein assembly factor BamD [Deltaproteobacteria bacterium]
MTFLSPYLRRGTSFLVACAMGGAPVVARAQPPAEDPTAGMTEEQKLERAKQLFAEANAALEAEDFATAVQKFEEAYLVYAPNLHVFNFNIGSAAFYAGDCIKAKQALQRFLDLVPDHPERATAQEMLLEIERTKCAETQAAQAQPTPQPQPQPEPQPQTAVPRAEDNEDAPILESRREERERMAEAELEAEAKKKPSGLLIGGAVLTALGAAAGVGGAVTLGMAYKTAGELKDLASSGSIGFPSGSYADDEVYRKDNKQLPMFNAVGITLTAVGGAMFVTGVALIAVDAAKKKKAKREEAARRRVRLVGAGPIFLSGGAGAGASVRF